MRGRALLIATHYAPRRPDGTPDHFNHGLENAEELLALCARVPRTAILHGHIHRRFHVHTATQAHLFGAGSATHQGREGFWLFDVEATRVHARPGVFRDGEYRLEGDSVEF